MTLDNLTLRTKTMIPLAAMAAAALGLVAFGAAKLIGVSREASQIIEQRDVGATHLIRARAVILTNTNALFGTLVYDGDSVEGHRSQDDFPASIKEGADRFDEAKRFLPDHADELQKLEDRFAALVEHSKAPFKIGQDTPGLADGVKLKPADLAEMARGAKLLADVDVESRGLIKDVRKLYETVLGENAAAAEALRAQSVSALIGMAATGLLAILLTGAVALWITSVKIAAPLGRLAHRMKALAAGDLGVEIEGQRRRDEVGQMAAAVQVFKATALAKIRGDAEAAAQRAAAQDERERAAAEKARSDAAAIAAMQRLARGLNDLASGDLTVRVRDGYAEQHAPIMNTFNASVERLEGAMRSVVRTAGALRSRTGEISAAAETLSQRTEEQAASLEQTSAALGEITATVRKSAEGARHASDVVASANRDAENGASVVRQAVDAMDAIAKSSQQIGQIIGVIDEIAFQTNLLALNAGVEAARAGEAGRGFAVVASEVRALAQRSAEAAKEIKALVSASGAQVDSGVTLVAETGAVLERIMSQVSEINRVVGGIATGAQDQATSLSQVNATINQMDQTTQQNATMAQESKAASRALTDETNQLAELVGQFRVAEAARREPAASARASPRAPGAARPAAPAASRLAAA